MIQIHLFRNYNINNPYYKEYFQKYFNSLKKNLINLGTIKYYINVIKNNFLVSITFIKYIIVPT